MINNYGTIYELLKKGKKIPFIAVTFTFAIASISIVLSRESDIVRLLFILGIIVSCTVFLLLLSIIAFVASGIYESRRSNQFGQKISSAIETIEKNPKGYSLFMLNSLFHSVDYHKLAPSIQGIVIIAVLKVIKIDPVFDLHMNRETLSKLYLSIYVDTNNNVDNKNEDSGTTITQRANEVISFLGDNIYHDAIAQFIETIGDIDLKGKRASELSSKLSSIDKETLVEFQKMIDSTLDEVHDT